MCVQLAPARLWAQLRQPDASHAPYFSGAYLPGRRDVRTYMDMSPSYMPLLHNGELVCGGSCRCRGWHAHGRLVHDTPLLLLACQCTCRTLCRTMQARALRASQTALQQAWQQHKQVYLDAAGDDSMTLDDLAYSMALVSGAPCCNAVLLRQPASHSRLADARLLPACPLQLQTRLFYFEHVGAMLVPVADMANHANACPHTISGPLTSTCGLDSQRGCVVWRAGADIPAGGEACYAYTRHMLNDRALLQYFFLMVSQLERIEDSVVSCRVKLFTTHAQEQVAGELNGIDRHDFDAAKGIWANQQHGKAPPFSGAARSAHAAARVHAVHCSTMHYTPPKGHDMHDACRSRAACCRMQAVRMRHAKSWPA